MPFVCLPRMGNARNTLQGGTVVHDLHAKVLCSRFMCHGFQGGKEPSPNQAHASRQNSIPYVPVRALSGIICSQLLFAGLDGPLHHIGFQLLMSVPIPMPSWVKVVLAEEVTTWASSVSFKDLLDGWELHPMKFLHDCG